MRKKLPLFLVAIYLLMCNCSVLYAESSRWQKISSDNVFIDSKTIEYDKKEACIYYWVKITFQNSNNNELLYYMKYPINGNYTYEIMSSQLDRYNYPSHVTKNDTLQARFITPSSMDEKIVNTVCQMMNCPLPYKTPIHRWKLISQQIGNNAWEICEDVFFYDPINAQLTVVLRWVLSDRTLSERYIFDLKNKKYAILFKPWDQNYDYEWKDIIPDTEAEAIFYAAQELINK